MSSNELIIINVLGGICVLSSYFYYIPKIGLNNLSKQIPSSMRYVFLFSIVLATICYLLAMISEINNPGIIKSPQMFYLGLILFFVASSFWAPCIYYNYPKYITILCLSIVSFGILLMLLSISDNLTMLCLLYLFLHCLILDNIVWSHYYLQN